MTTTTTTSKPLYLSINKLMGKSDENKKLNCNNDYTHYFELDNVRYPIEIDKSLILILDGKYMYENKFNKEQYNCIPIALSVYPGEFLSCDNLCKPFNCSKLHSN